MEVPCTNHVCALSEKGPRPNNEDNFLVLELPDAYLLAVADGLGGHNAGEVASQMAVDILRDTFSEEYRKGMSVGEIEGLLRKAHERADSIVRENAVGEKKGMGTTLVSAVVLPDKAVVANTGDSRAWLIRDGELVARTKDHSPLQDLIDSGEISEEEAFGHPLSNFVKSAIGVKKLLIDTYLWSAERGDVLLLSTDGLHDYVRKERILQIVSSGEGADEIARMLIDAALPVTKDNVTVVVWKW